jgi:hypothetical protein
MNLGAVDEQLPVDRQRGSYPQALPGSAIDLIGDGVQVFLAVDRKRSACGVPVGRISTRYVALSW